MNGIRVIIDGGRLLIYKDGQKQTGVWVCGFLDGIKERLPKDKEQRYKASMPKNIKPK